jgi:TolB-like protein/tetratricopeptide (TPR) repeat protein
VSPDAVAEQIQLLREALGDDVEAPRYVGTVPDGGYRFLGGVGTLPPEAAGLTRSLFSELGRRRVVQAALLYVAVAWSITEIVSFLIEALPVFPNWSMALVAILFIVGFPVTMFLAWRFDIGPGGIRKTGKATRGDRLTVATALLMLVLTTTGLFYLIYPRVVDQAGDAAQTVSRPTVEGTTIAVMPFVNVSNNPEDSFISEGLPDELRDQLGRISGLRVAARSSSISFRESGADAPTIAQQLGVSKLVEGSVRVQGEELRVTIEIIDGATGFADWNSSYTRHTGDLLDVQQQIAAEVIRQVLPEIEEPLVVAEPPTLNASAHELMLLARYHYQEDQEAATIDMGRMMRVINLYQRAIELDPNSALAYSRLAEAWLYLGVLDEAQGPINKALSIDPNLSEVQNTLGLYRWRRYDEGVGEAHLRAIELNPNNAEALENYAKWFWSQQITDEVEPYFLRARELDPMNLTRYLDLGHFYAISNRRDEALTIIEQVEERFTGPNAYMALARLYELVGDLDVGIAWALKALELDPFDPVKSWQVAELYARIGDFESAHIYESEVSPFDIRYWERRYDDMIQIGEELTFNPPVEIQVWYGLARAHAAVGNFDTARYLLESTSLPENAYVASRRANGMEASVTLADSLHQLGEIERARELAAWLASSFSSLSDTGAGDSWWPNLYEACLLSILDEDSDALETLERVNNSIGLLWYPVLMDAPCFRKYKDNRRYQTVVRNYEERLEMLRERLPDTLAEFQTVD